MTMQSKFATYGECVTIKQRPVAQYAPWANPYGQWRDQDGYAAAWRASLKAAPIRDQSHYNVNVEQRVKYLNALSGGARTTAEISDVVGQAINTVRKVLITLHGEGLVERVRGIKNPQIGTTADTWCIASEAAE